MVSISEISLPSASFFYLFSAFYDPPPFRTAFPTAFPAFPTMRGALLRQRDKLNAYREIRVRVAAFRLHKEL